MTDHQEPSPTPYYADDHATIHCGDVAEVLRSIAPESVDCIVTSPPYNQLGSRIPAVTTGLFTDNKWAAKVAANGYADDMPEGEYVAWLASVASDLLRVAKPGASLFFNHKLRYRDRRPLHPIDIVRRFDGWDLRQEIVWDTTRTMVLNARMFAPIDERIYWLVKPGANYTWNQDALATSVWRIRSAGSESDHPCPFPREIPARCIAATPLPGGVVLDPFMGSGSTLRSAKNLGRQSVGIEIDPKWCGQAVALLAQEVLHVA